MKKFTYLLFLTISVTACSVESIDSTENLLTADFSFDDSEFEVVSHDFYTGNDKNPNYKGTLSVSQDCNNLYIAITGNPDEVYMGVFNENQNPSLKNNSKIEHTSLSENLASATNYEWVFPLSTFTSESVKVFARSWGGKWAGEEVYADGNYLIYNLNTCEPVCAYGKGYWKNHGPYNPGGQSNMYPVENLMIAGESYDQVELQEFLWNTGNIGEVEKMKQHLIAVLLNIGNGVVGTSIASTIADAEAVILGNSGNLNVNDIKDSLEAFNEENGCEDFDEQEF